MKMLLSSLFHEELRTVGDTEMQKLSFRIYVYAFLALVLHLEYETILGLFPKECV